MDCSTAITNDQTGAVPSLQPFAEGGARYAALGLTPIPVNFEKRPAVKNWQQLSPSTHCRLMARFAGYNVGVLNGRKPLPITVVDIDDPDERDWCRARFGDTPVKVRTPGGGEHWYYRANGEQRRTRFEGHKVDLLGEGGFGVVPPSHTPEGMYAFIEGDAEAFCRLPRLYQGEPTLPATSKADGRNDTLFRALLLVAANVHSYEALLDDARARNQQFGEPLGDGEVCKTAGSVWRYKVENRLMVPGCESTFVFRDSLVEKCLQCPDALALLAKIKKLHGHKGGAPFELPAATGPQIMGWSRDRYLRARNHLVSIGELILVTAGEKGKRHPTVVRLPTIRNPVTT